LNAALRRASGRLLEKARLYSWGAAQAIRLGRPDVSLGFLGGLGDDLLCTAPIEEALARGARRVWFFSRHPELYRHLDSRVRLVPEAPRYRRLAQLLGRPMIPMGYCSPDPGNPDRSFFPDHPIIAEMCRIAGLHGKIAIRPHLPINPAERGSGLLRPRQIAIQSTCLNSRMAFRTKDWGAHRFAEVARRLAGEFNLVQVGDARDTPLPVAVDLRGHPELRHVAAVLSASELFIGLEGFLAHLARAVDCPSVIIMGGRVPVPILGYSCNENLFHPVECAPCGLMNTCPNALACLEGIPVQAAVDAVHRLAARRLPRPLPADSFVLP
jgi:hypothetical protein